MWSKQQRHSPTVVLALNRVNVVAVITILVVHVDVIGHHAACHDDFTFSRRSYHARWRARGVRGASPPEREVWNISPPAGQQGFLEGGKLPNDRRD